MARQEITIAGEPPTALIVVQREDAITEESIVASDLLNQNLPPERPQYEAQSPRRRLGALRLIFVVLR